jgi:hypothetical protein
MQNAECKVQNAECKVQNEEGEAGCIRKIGGISDRGVFKESLRVRFAFKEMWHFL